MKYLMILVFLSSCTYLSTPSSLELWARLEAQKYSPDAQISYLKCEFAPSRQQCLEDSWKKYGAPAINEKSTEEWKRKALAFIKEMDRAGAGYVLRGQGYNCNQVSYFDNILFSSNKMAVCDGVRYKIKYKHKWDIQIIAN